MITALFTACKGDETSEESAASTTEKWKVEENEDYQAVEVEGVELAQVIEEALGDEVDDFDGDTKTLTPAQVEKIKAVASKKGMTVEQNVEGEIEVKREVKVTEKEGSAEKGTNRHDNATTASPASPGGNKQYTNGSSSNNSKNYENASVGFKPSATANVLTAATLTTFSNEKPKAASFGFVSAYTESSNTSFNDVTTSSDGSVAVGVKGAGSSYGALIVKYSDRGSKEWEDTLQGDKNTDFQSVTVLKDGSIVAVGQTSSEDLLDKDEYMASGTVEALVAKYSKSGSREFVKVVGGSMSDMAYAVAATSDGGFVIGGKTDSRDGTFDKFEDEGRIHGFVIKMTADGKTEWVWGMDGGSKHTKIQALSQDSEGNIYAAIDVCSHENDFAEYENPYGLLRYCLVVKLSSKGELIWKKQVYESGNLNVTDMICPTSGGCAIVGYYTVNLNRERGTLKNFDNYGSNTGDGFFIHFSKEGEIGMMNTFIGFDNDLITGISEMDNYFAISAYSKSESRDFDCKSYEEYDAFVFLVDLKTAKIKTTITFGGSATDRANAVCCSGSNIYVAGTTYSGDEFFKNCGISQDQSNATAYVTKYILNSGEK